MKKGVSCGGCLLVFGILLIIFISISAWQDDYNKPSSTENNETTVQKDNHNENTVKQIPPKTKVTPKNNKNYILVPKVSSDFGLYSLNHFMILQMENYNNSESLKGAVTLLQGCMNVQKINNQRYMLACTNNYTQDSLMITLWFNTPHEMQSGLINRPIIAIFDNISSYTTISGLKETTLNFIYYENNPKLVDIAYKNGIVAKQLLTLRNVYSITIDGYNYDADIANPVLGSELLHSHNENQE